MTPLDAPEPGFRDMAPFRRARTAGPGSGSRGRPGPGRPPAAAGSKPGSCAPDARPSRPRAAELLLSDRQSAAEAGALAASLLAVFGTAPRVLAAPRPTGCAPCRASPGRIAAIKAAEALGIRMAREEVPDTVRPSFGNYDKVIEYWRTLAGHREVEEFRVLYLDRKNRLVADELHQSGTVCTRRSIPRDLRACAGTPGERGHRNSRPSVGGS